MSAILSLPQCVKHGIIAGVRFWGSRIWCFSVEIFFNPITWTTDIFSVADAAWKHIKYLCFCILPIELKKIIFSSFIRSNFECCPLVWHFCGKTNNQKLEKIQERSLRILHDTFELTYEELLHKNGSSSLLLYRLKLFIIETYKSFHHMNAECLHDLFQLNNTTYETSKRKTTSNGLRTFSYLGSKLWNDLVNSEPAIANIEFDELIESLKDWEGPNTNDGFPYVWHVPCLIFLCILRITFLHMSCSESFLCIPYFMYISTAL